MTTAARMDHVIASVKRATIDRATLIVAAVYAAVSQHGYDVALYGSTAKFGEGRDYDLLVFPTRLYPAPGNADELVDELRTLGFEILSVETEGLVPGWYGILATFHGYAIDITVRP